MGSGTSSLPSGGPSIPFGKVRDTFGGGGGGRPGGKRRFNQGGKAGQSFGQLENLLLSYEDLVAQGRIGPNERGFEGLEPGQSRFGRGLEAYESSLAEGSPIFAAYQHTIQQGLKGIES